MNDRREVASRSARRSSALRALHAVVPTLALLMVLRLPALGEQHPGALLLGPVNLGSSIDPDLRFVDSLHRCIRIPNDAGIIMRADGRGIALWTEKTYSSSATSGALFLIHNGFGMRRCSPIRKPRAERR